HRCTRRADRYQNAEPVEAWPGAQSDELIAAAVFFDGHVKPGASKHSAAQFEVPAVEVAAAEHHGVPVAQGSFKFGQTIFGAAPASGPERARAHARERESAHAA